MLHVRQGHRVHASKQRDPSRTPQCLCQAAHSPQNNASRWSSGQDVALSRRNQGFDSPTGYQMEKRSGVGTSTARALFFLCQRSTAFINQAQLARYLRRSGGFVSDLVYGLDYLLRNLTSSFRVYTKFGTVPFTFPASIFTR